MKKLVKLGIAGLMVTLLAISMITCTDGGPGGGGPGTGNGYVIVNLGEAKLPRTILPDLSLGDIDYFEFIFTAALGGVSDSFTIPYDGSESDPIALFPGTYILNIIGYTPTNTAIVEGTESGVLIEAGKTTIIKDFELYAYSSQGTGNYKYNIDFSGITGGANSLTEALMIISQGAERPAYNLKTDPTDTILLPSGQYNVRFKITKGEGIIDFSQALYIYRNLDSEFEFEFDDTHFGPQTVTFVYNDNIEDFAGTNTPPAPGTTTGTKVADMKLGEYITAPPASDLSGAVYTAGNTYNFPLATTPPPSRPYQFIGWYYMDGATEKPFIFADDSTNSTSIPDATQIMGNMTVFAKWKGNSMLDDSATFKLMPMGGTPLILTGTGQAPAALPEQQHTLTVSASGADTEIEIDNTGDYSDWGWYRNNQLLGALNSPTLSIKDTTLQAPFVPGFRYIIEVRAIENDGSAQSYLLEVIVTP